MLRCKFYLNSQPLSNLSCPGVGFFPASSGFILRVMQESVKVALPCLQKITSLHCEVHCWLHHPLWWVPRLGPMA